LLDNIESSRAVLETIWPSFPLRPAVFWAAVCFVLLQIGYWIVRPVKRHFWKRDMMDRITFFLNSWDALLNAHSAEDAQEVGKLMSNLMILWAPIGPFVRSQARVTYYGSPARRIFNPDYDLIGNFLVGNSQDDFETSWRVGRQMLLGSLGALGAKPA
jgi:hypothetical protein